MARFALGVLAIALVANCNHSRCAPGEVPNDLRQACVRPPQCDAGVINDRNECVLSQPNTAADGSDEATELGAERTQQDAGTARSGDLAAAGSGGGVAGGQAGHSGEAGESQGAARCGNGSVDQGEKCDGSCPTQCNAAANKCVATKLEGAAQTCDAECVSSEISDCIKGDGCCPEGCTYATDDGCSQSCGDGVLSGAEKCEPGSADHPCPTARDCDDRDPCTEDVVIGGQCSAECANMLLTRMPVTCDDGNPCTDDMLVESSSSCTYECMHSDPRRPAGSCADSDACTDDTPVMSSTACEYECPHPEITRRANGDGCCPRGALRRDDSDCDVECLTMQDCQQGMNCEDGRCTTPPPRCGDGKVDATEQCDDGNQDTADGCIDCLVARCGDGYVRTSEECDPAADGWQSICASSCLRTAYGICPASGCKYAGQEIPCGTAGAYCSPICTQDSDCPAMPGHRIECAGAYQCVIRCSGGCPNGMHCIEGDHCGYR